MSDRRGPVLALVAGLLALGLGVDRLQPPQTERERATEVRAGAGGDAPATPVAGDGDAFSSTWFCAGGTAAPGGAADTSVVVANAGDRALKGTVTVVPKAGSAAAKAVAIEVPARDRRSVRLQDVVAADHAGAVVDLDGGLAAVEQSVTGPLGDATSACAPEASTAWHFAQGTTAKGATLLLALLNPFPEDAIADLAFATEQGRAEPSELQGVVVPGRSLTVVDVGAHVRRREAVAGTVTARGGRLVVSRLQLVGEGAAKGITLSTLAASAGDVWRFSDGYAAEGIAHRWHVYNPTDREAAVDIEIDLDEGAAEPFELTVPPHGRVVVAASEEDRIPKNVAFASVVRSVGGVPVVAERTTTATAPAPRPELGALFGSRVVAEAWLFAAGGATDLLDEWLYVHNPGTRPTEIDVVALASGQLLPVEGLQDVRLAAGERRSIRLGDHLKRPDLALLVRGGEPLVVERGLYRVGDTGADVSLGVPLPPARAAR